MPVATSLIVDIETRMDTGLATHLGYVPKKDGEFAPLILHLPCAIAVGRMDSEGVLVSVESLGADDLYPDDPRELTAQVWAEITRAAVLVTFNGRGFDLPVLELCALRYGVAAPKHWTAQYGTRYRYSKEHLDLLDVLSNYGRASRGYTLSHLVQLLGYQGKDGMDGSMVQAAYDAGQYDVIRQYNRTDCIRTFALWLQWARISGRLTPELYEAALVASKPFLDQIRRTEEEASACPGGDGEGDVG